MVRGAFSASLEVTFGRVTEQTATLHSKEEQGGIFFLSVLLGSSWLMHSSRVHVLAEEGSREGAYKGDEMHGPLALANPLCY